MPLDDCDDPRIFYDGVNHQGERQVRFAFYMTGMSTRLVGPFADREKATDSFLFLKNALGSILVDAKVLGHSEADPSLPHIEEPISDDWFSQVDNGGRCLLLVNCTPVLFSPTAQFQIGPFDGKSDALLALEAFLADMEGVFLDHGIPFTNQNIQRAEQKGI